MKETIEVYYFNLRRKNGKKNLSFSYGEDIYELLKKGFTSFIDSTKTGPVNPAEKRTVRIPAAVDGNTFWGSNDAYRSVYGILESGVYGKKLEVVDKDDPKQVLYASKDDNAAVIKPFFFLICAPRTGDKGFLILERTDNEGIFNLFHILLYSFLKEKLPWEGQQQEYTIKPHNYLSHEYIETLKNGTIKSVRLSVSQLPKDLTDRYMMDGIAEVASMSIVLSFKNGLLPNTKLAKAIKDNTSIFSTVKEGFQDIFQDSQRSIVTDTKINGVSKERTVYLSEDSQRLIRPYYLLDVDAGPKGYPSFASIKDAAFAFIDANQDLKQLTQ